MSSWFSPKTEKRTSPIEGRGLFARRAIAAGEVVAVKGGSIMDSAAFALVRGQITFVAMHDIPAGSELTIDYAMIDGDPAERMECSCGAPECRKVITGSDWRQPELRRRYAGYFSRYIQDRFGADGA